MLHNMHSPNHRIVSPTKSVKVALALATVAGVVAFAVPAGATDAHYTDGTQCEGGFCSLPSNPPPTSPHFGKDCQTDIIDPPSFVYVTEHFVYGTTAPASTVPVTDDASAVFNYHGVAPGEFSVDIAAEVAGKQGFRADTWNIGKGVTAWVPFDCRPAPTTTTTVPTSSTTTSTTFVEIGTPISAATPAPAVHMQPVGLTG